MRTFIYILSCFFVGTLFGNLNADHNEIINKMKEIELNIVMPKENSPITLKISSPMQVNSIKLNKNAFLSGFFAYVNIEYKDGSSRVKMFCPVNTSFMRTDFQNYKLKDEIPINFVTSSIFNTLYQNIKELKIQEAVTVSIKIYFIDLTENSKREKITYATNRLSFSRDEILKIISLYKIEPEPANFINR